ncbi:hypothetical protein Tco_1351016, partial [Tanacetum coccineum]
LGSNLLNFFPKETWLSPRRDSPIVHTIVYPPDHPKDKSGLDAFAKLTRAKLNKRSRDADLLKDKSGTESPSALQRSWYVEGHVRSGVISSVLVQRYPRKIRQRYSPREGPQSLLGDEGLSSGGNKLNSIFEELSQKFLEEISQQKRYAKDLTEIHGIKRRQNEGLQAFMDRFKSESSHINGVPLVLRILAFMHGHGYPELAKKLNDKILKTVDEMLERVKAFIRGEVAARSTEMVRPSQGDKGYVRPAWTGVPENHNTRIYSGSVTKHLFTLLHSSSTKLESSLHYVNKLPLGRDNRTQLSLHQFLTLSEMSSSNPS